MSEVKNSVSGEATVTATTTVENFINAGLNEKVLLTALLIKSDSMLRIMMV